MSKLDRETVRRIARLARIRVEENEFEPLAGELSKILGFVEQLSQVDTAAVEPLAAINGLTLPWREDRVADGGKADDVLANAPARAQGYYAVPKVVE
ncbi:MAG: Asp-tRNA(Asn)/Glu-tRNA(Gln) amidotransferase subunit GatC [Alphaproteobacteria bacterium]|nr:Asp-tRNA(Asn)/Glu-tRNA(Gln) amidotransferase subunit GatC [Alphaproteobacteria bacterium]